ncbi:MAG: VWA domain-containing protein [Deltaproteobacteria bacterium]|jgi:Ca-activated chloride channel family protein|nr:VWA domain-containing protein [Deltaproteobacteria bacterium]
MRSLNFGVLLAFGLLGLLLTAAGCGQQRHYAGMGESFRGPEAHNTEEYAAINETGFTSPIINPLSTFSINVDTASYSLVRAKLAKGDKITPDMVRLEEFVNYFSYHYPEPADSEPIAVSTMLSSCPWNGSRNLLQIGLSTKDLDMSKAPPSNLVLLLDVSGSMDSPDKIGLLRKSFALLVENLRVSDRISIVVYAGNEATLLDGATGAERAKILEVINSLYAEGSTHGEAGIRAAYGLARKNFIKGGINRILLATDGDFNVGISSEGDLARFIGTMRDSGVYLSVLGFGMGNYKDNKMEALSKNGNGNMYYIDGLLEAKKVLVEQMGATLNAVADDVKVQVEFNPSSVKAYRLLGYEHRRLAAEDFANDRVDAGEIGSGHSVTALYEIIPSDSDEEVPELELKYQKKPVTQKSADLGSVAIRWKDPGSSQSRLAEHRVLNGSFLDNPPDDFRWAAAAAELALVLGESRYAPKATLNGALKMAKSTDYKEDEYRREFVALLERMIK